MDDPDDASRITKIALTVMVVLVSVVAFSYAVIALLVEVKDLGEQNAMLSEQNATLNLKTVETLELLQECTSPGPREPTPDDPRTGNHCYDESRAGTAQAVRQIVDADNNGVIDSLEILDAVNSFRQFFDFPAAG